MSSKFPMVAIDKVEVKLTMKVNTIVAIDSIANMSGMSRASVINGYVEDGLKKSKYVATIADEKRAEEIKKANREKREMLKARK